MDELQRILSFPPDGKQKNIQNIPVKLSILSEIISIAKVIHGENVLKLF